MYRGDIRLGDTIDIKFTTRRGDTGAPTTLAGSPSVAAYVGNSTTEITAGITLTVDFDSRTGLNNVRVVATSGNGYATASNIDLVITAGTVNAVSVVGEVVGSFSIEARSDLMSVTAGRTVVVDANGLIDANAVKVGPTGSGTAQTARDIGLDTKNLVAGVLLRTGTAQAGSGVNITLDAGASISNNFYEGCLCVIVGGAGAGQARLIYNYNGTSKVALVYPAWAGTGPDNTSVFQLVSFSGAMVDYIGNLLTFQADVGLGCDLYSSQIGTMTFTGANINAHLAAGQLFFKKNTALNNFPFIMRDSTTHAPKPGLGAGVTATRKIDNTAFAACANAVAEIANGWYQINFAATDLNGTTIAFRFTAAGADDLDFTVITQS